MGGGSSPPLPPSWDAWLTASLDRLAGADRLRSLRPVHPGPDSARVLVPGAVWDAWMVDYGCGGVGGQGGEGARAAPRSPALPWHLCAGAALIGSVWAFPRKGRDHRLCFGIFVQGPR